MALARVVSFDGVSKERVEEIVETEDDYARGDETLNAMPAGDTPGRRTSVAKYDVAMRQTT
jgi:hypothetical protein